MTIKECIFDIKEKFMDDGKCRSAFIYSQESLPEVTTEIKSILKTPTIFKIACNEGAFIKDIKPEMILSTKRLKEYKNDILSIESKYFVHGYGYDEKKLKPENGQFVQAGFSQHYDHAHLFDRNQIWLPRCNISLYAGIFIAIYCNFRDIACTGIFDKSISDDHLNEFLNYFKYIQRTAPYIYSNTAIRLLNSDDDLLQWIRH